MGTLIEKLLSAFGRRPKEWTPEYCEAVMFRWRDGQRETRPMTQGEAVDQEYWRANK